MRAVRFAGYGGPEVLQVDQVPEPGEPVGDELLVRVHASSVNGTDLGLRRGQGKVATWRRLPFVPGFDLCGQVVRCGPAVTAFRPGDRVVALLGHRGGAQAELVRLRQGRAALAPSSCSTAAAAALPLAGLTALQALHGAAALHARPPGCRVLVVGAAGGIGSYAVQLADLAGAHVTGMASGAKLAFVRDLGADEVLERPGSSRDTDSDTGPGGQLAALGRFDVVLDTPGRLGLRQVLPALSDDGVLVSTRPIGPDAVRALVPRRASRSRARFAAVMTRARSQDLAHLAALVDDGRLRPPVDRVLPLDQVVAAHRHAEGPVRGKVVLTLARDQSDQR